jgi:DNA-directed RNA polymerase subunit RPC12/RpoP/rubrerythrin
VLTGIQELLRKKIMKLNTRDLTVKNNKLYIKERIVKNNDVVFFDCIECGKETHKRGELLKKTLSLVCGNCSRKKTNIEKYGVSNPQKSEVIKQKTSNTKLLKYGNSGFNNREKAVKTNLKKYGVENPSQNKAIKKKREKTLIENYGVSHNFKSGVLREKIQNNKRNNFYKNLIGRNNSEVAPMFDLNDYVDSSKKYKWFCKKCGNIFEDHLNNGHIPRCFACYPKVKGTSRFEKEIKEFISQKTNNIVENSFSIIPPQQLDFYLPEYNIAIEFNGLYWHSELNGKDMYYHLNKTLSCEKKGIRLIHIFEDEWVNNRPIVESIINSAMGFNNKFYARKCTIKEVENQKDFLDENHIQGYIPAKVNLGLYYNNELLSLLTFGVSRFNKNYDWEILRYVNKLNTSVVGGFARLLKYFKNNNSGSIITYSDRRLFNGSIYIENGFNKLNPSKPSYYYIKSPYIERYNRQQFQKHKLMKKLDTFKPNLTEWQNMQLNGWDRIWDCGNNVFTQEKNYET